MWYWCGIGVVLVWYWCGIGVVVHTFKLFGYLDGGIELLQVTRLARLPTQQLAVGGRRLAVGDW